jgi:hypothetical protein
MNSKKIVTPTTTTTIDLLSLEWVLIGYIQFIMRSVLKTDLIINWIYPIKTHGERLGHRIRNLTRRDTLLMLGGRADIGLHTPARERRPCS